MNVLEAITKSTDFLNKKGISEPRLNAELLLADILKMSRLSLYLCFEQELIPNEVDRYREFLLRRSKFEPLQYIIGNVEFFGLKFIVNPSVLIPRQETEILVDSILNMFKGKENLNILDIGTGSGNIIITLIKNLPLAKGTTIDINDDALKLAKENAELNGVKERINFAHINILEDVLNVEDKFDIIVSNPPYIPIEEYPGLQKELTEYEPKEALTDFRDGYTFYRVILEKAKQLLKNKGWVFFETGDKMSDELKDLFRKNNYQNINSNKDLLSIERVIFGEYIESSSSESI